MLHGRGIFGALNERAPFVVTLESADDGSLRFAVRAADERRLVLPAQRVFTLVTWCEDEVVRFRLDNPETGLVAYAQGGAPLLTFARALGLSVER